MQNNVYAAGISNHHKTPTGMTDVHLYIITNTVLLLRCMTAAVRVKQSLSSGWSSGLIATVGSFELLSNNFR
jgi:hypothetical protein